MILTLPFSGSIIIISTFVKNSASCIGFVAKKKRNRRAPKEPKSTGTRDDKAWELKPSSRIQDTIVEYSVVYLTNGFLEGNVASQ